MVVVWVWEHIAINQLQVFESALLTLDKVPFS